MWQQLFYGVVLSWNRWEKAGRWPINQVLGQSVIHPVFKAVGMALGRFINQVREQSPQPQLALVA